ncbi:MAG: glycosyltransferase [Gordonia sp. (in: high G+C Gram-positive bacteria)]
MRFGFVLHGSRGDVQPGVALGAALARAGHQVTVAVPANLADAVARTGITTRILCPSTDELLADEVIKVRLKSRRPLVRMRALREVGAYGVQDSERVMGELADKSDVLISGLLAQERAATIAESRGIAFHPLHYCPVRPNSVVNPTPWPLPPMFNRAVWSLADRVYWHSVRTRDRALRHELGLPPAKGPLGTRLTRLHSAEIQAYDPVFFPGLATQWGHQRPFTGFLVPDTVTLAALNGTADATDEALTWARSATPPVYLGFGSMPVAGVRIAEIADILVALGHRVIAHTSATLTPTDDVYQIRGPIDHAALLPACSGAVHHGGAGTTAAAARAGIPMVIGWLSADQPMWGRAIHRRGAGTTARLSHLGRSHLEALGSREVVCAAQQLATLISTPDAAAAAAYRYLTPS